MKPYSTVFLTVLIAISFVTIIEYQEVFAPPPVRDPSYSVDVLDVYESASTTLDSGTPVCLDVSITAGGTCSGTLTHGNTYRFEFEVTNTGAGAGSPTNAEFKDSVGSPDVLGTILDVDLGGAGCGTIADWDDTVTSPTVFWSAVTTCEIAKSGTEEFYVIATVDTDACEGTATATFFIDDGTFDAESGPIIFNLKSMILIAFCKNRQA